MGHPELLYYRDTLEGEFPLLLVISRGADNAEPATPEVASYDFDEQRSGLWNSTYRLLASANGLETVDVKAACRERGASPVLFAECSTVSVPAPVARKRAIRSTVTVEQGEEHARSVLSHGTFIDRVSLAIFSGVEGNEFEASRDAYRAVLLERGVPWVNMRYLFGNNMRRVLDELSDPARTKLGWIYRRFLDGRK